MLASVFGLQGDLSLMSAGMSPENERFLADVVAAGQFRDRAEALDTAVGLLRKRQELLAHVDAGLSDLEQGRFNDYDRESLERRFDELAERARRGSGAAADGQ